MEFVEITEQKLIYPGEYLFHVPTQTMVICGAIKDKNMLQVLLNGRIFTDSLQNFKKIKGTQKELQPKRRGCGGCKK